MYHSQIFITLLHKPHFLNNNFCRHPVGGVAGGLTPGPLLLASGDSDGRVVVWDVLLGTPIATLEDAYYAGFGATEGARRADSPRVPVRALSWVTARNLLAILLAPGYLVLWDYRSGGVVWRRDFGSTDAFNSMKTDPCDRRRLVLSTAAGAFSALRLDAPSADKTRHQRFQAEITAGSLRCALPGARDLILLLLQRELIAFDLEYGHPVASTSLSSGMPAFNAVLGSYGDAVAGGSPFDSGIDAVYCSHVDGSISIWQRREGSLEYCLISHAPLAPAALSKAAGVVGGGGGGQLVALVAGAWPRQKSLGDGIDGRKKLTKVTGSSAIGAMKVKTRATGPGRVRQVTALPSSTDTDPVVPVLDLEKLRQRASTASTTDGLGTNSTTEAPIGYVVVLALSADGALWRWQLPLVIGTGPPPGTASPRPNLSLSSECRLLGCCQSLTHQVTAFSAFPGDLTLPGADTGSTPSGISRAASTGSLGGTTSSTEGTATAAGVLVAGTAAGTLELVTIQRGKFIPLHLAVASALSVHPAAVAGVRWLGRTSRVASFSSQRLQAAGGTTWKNALYLTDFISGGSMAFRDGTTDRGPLTGLRASPNGAYLLLIFSGLPSEVWATPEGHPPFRLRQVDLPFTSVEWILPAERPDMKEPIKWGPPPAPPTPPSPVGLQRNNSNPLLQRGGSGPVEGVTGALTPRSRAIEDLPEERMVFTLADGRVGVLSVLGRRIQDTKPRMPSWPQLASGEFRAACAASYGPLVFLGGTDGVLVRWDTSTGRTLAVDAGCGRIHGLVVAPTGSYYTLDPNQNHEAAKVAVLASSGAYAVLALDVTGQLRPTVATWAAGAATLGRAQAIDWVSLPDPYGNGGVLAVAVETGSLALIDVTGKRRKHEELGAKLAPAPKFSSPLLLPWYHRLLLRILLQRGVPALLLRDAGSGEGPTAKVESELRGRLPPGCAAALGGDRRNSSGHLIMISPRSPSVVSPTTSTGEVAATGSMAALLAESKQGGNNSSGGGFLLGSPDSRSGSGVEEAALKLGYRQPSQRNLSKGGEVSQTIRTLGGAVKTMAKDIAKDVATVSKDQLNKTLARVGDVGGSSSNLQEQGYQGGYPQQQAPVAPLPPLTSLGGFNAHRQNNEGPRAGSLVGALAAAAALRSLDCPLNEVEMEAYEAALASGSIAQRMEVAATVGGCPEEVAFWRLLPATLRELRAAVNEEDPTSKAWREGGTAGNGSPRKADSSILWSPAAVLAAAGERSGWHNKMSRRVFEASESLQEKRVLEYLSLGDLHAAVGFLLASPPSQSARFYRDALCTLGMAFACGLQQPQSPRAAATDANASASPRGRPGQLIDAAARTLFVQSAKIVSANAAGVGDTLLGVPLMCATGEFNDAVNILQDSGMWPYAAALAAGSLPRPARAAPLERWATHVADAEGRLWAAAGLMVGAGLVSDAADLLAQSGLADAAAALVVAVNELGLSSNSNTPTAVTPVTPAAAATTPTASMESPRNDTPRSSLSRKSGASRVAAAQGVVDEETAAAVAAAFESYTTHVLCNI